MNFGEYMKARRRFAKYKIEELSDITGYSIRTLRDFEDNKKRPVVYRDIVNSKADNNIKMFNDYLKFCRLTETLRFEMEDVERHII